ncbi:hypothetical protein H6G81_09190 [Scytonema hofmannii FACHB-248]|uniref:Uncharacterized protein n=2 Tax=Cyanophyceae TaxID=3028117 RepID=A0ABR8GMQ1_9CYAN|nr:MULTISPECIES: hypothetical protein [Nostocales]MBD2604699.1 hypothetical protein [Scytonema hofmannii FACHB-248]
MTREELLAYIRKHPQDIQTFHKYMDLLATAPDRVEISVEELETKLAKRLQES